tara:strand:- start:201 stop:527 length:327 start_codon:yes stop_codon:yes gene_type:complete
LQALHRAQTSELRGTIRCELYKLKPRRRHRFAHHAAHHSEPCEIGGVVEMLRSEDARDDDVVGKAGDGLARVSIAFALSLARASFRTERRNSSRRGECARRCGRVGVE